MDGSLIIQDQKKNRFEDISPIRQQKKQTSFIKVGSVADLKNSQTEPADIRISSKVHRKNDRNNLNQLHNIKGLHKDNVREKSNTYNTPIPIRDGSIKSNSERSTLRMKNHLAQSTANLEGVQSRKERSREYQSQISQSRRKEVKGDEMNFKNLNIN